MYTFWYKLFIFGLITMTTQSTLEDIIGIPNFRHIKNFIYGGIGHTSDNSRIINKARQLHKIQDRVSDDVPFPCSTEGFRSETPPTSVHQVRPGDIDVIGAMGDSITVGVGLIATNVLNFIVENRGLSWSIGGQGNWREFTTLPNILKEFNPNLFGYSLSDAISIEKNSQFNVAEAGAISEDMPYMAQVLVKRIKADPRVKIDEHWKLITYMIGPNDFCTELCFMQYPEKSIERFRQVQINVLRILRDALPKTIINFIPTPHLKELRMLTEENQPSQCRPLNLVECPCLFGYQYQKHLERYYKIVEKWQEVNEEVAAMEEFDKDDFTIVYQPFTKHTSVPTLPNNLSDYSFMSQDCFHLSQKLNAAVSNGLWNNMMEPQQHKSTKTLPLFQRFLCPTPKFPYIFTRRNSMDYF